MAELGIQVRMSLTPIKGSGGRDLRSSLISWGGDCSSGSGSRRILETAHSVLAGV
jgi:hypothetical protein